MSTRVTVDSLLITPLQKSLAMEITAKAQIYNGLFNSLALYCDTHLDEPGVMAATTIAVRAISQNTNYNLFLDPSMNELALRAARAMLEMQEAGARLTETGIPYEGYCELSRRVTDQNLPGSQPILVPLEGY